MLNDLCLIHPDAWFWIVCVFVLVSPTHGLLFCDHSTRFMSPFSAPAPKTDLQLSLCSWWYVWPHGTRSWTPGFTSCWGGVSWGGSSCCSTASGLQSPFSYRTGTAARSTARWMAATMRPLRKTAACSVECVPQIPPSNPSPEPQSEWLWRESIWGWRNRRRLWTLSSYVLCDNMCLKRSQC